jgi:hypothetical protein
MAFLLLPFLFWVGALLLNCRHVVSESCILDSLIGEASFL